MDEVVDIVEVESARPPRETVVMLDNTTDFSPKCHGSTSSPSALMRRVLRGGVTVLEEAGVLARGTRSCT